MKVKCLADSLTLEQQNLLKYSQSENPSYNITPGEEYTVLGMTFIFDPEVSDWRGALVEIMYHWELSVSIPLILFEVVDPRPSKYWQIRQCPGELDVLMWPEEFYREYFHDKLTDDYPEEVKAFREVVEKLEKEFEIPEDPEETLKKEIDKWPWGPGY